MMKLVMGLGNPGEQYKNHRHNIGYMILDRIAKKLDVELDIKKKKTIFGRSKKGKIEYLLLKPQTFTKLSGEAALYMASFMKISVDDIIVIYDDMNLPIGQFEIIVSNDNYLKYNNYYDKFQHNGVLSIVESLKSDNFTKIGVGIGVPNIENFSDTDISEFLLSPFTKVERKKIKDISDDIVDATCIALFESPQAAKKKYS